MILSAYKSVTKILSILMHTQKNVYKSDYIISHEIVDNKANVNAYLHRQNPLLLWWACWRLLLLILPLANIFDLIENICQEKSKYVNMRITKYFFFSSILKHIFCIGYTTNTLTNANVGIGKSSLDSHSHFRQSGKRILHTFFFYTTI